MDVAGTVGITVGLIFWVVVSVVLFAAVLLVFLRREVRTVPAFGVWMVFSVSLVMLLREVTAPDSPIPLAIVAALLVGGLQYIGLYQINPPRPAADKPTPTDTRENDAAPIRLRGRTVVLLVAITASCIVVGVLTAWLLDLPLVGTLLAALMIDAILAVGIVFTELGGRSAV